MERKNPDEPGTQDGPATEHQFKNAGPRAQWQGGQRTIKLTSDDDGRVYEFAWPINHHISRFARESASNALKAHTNLVISLAITPAAEELQRLFEAKPGLPIALGNEIGKATGITEEFTVKN